MNPKQPGTKRHPTGQRLRLSLLLTQNKQRWQRSAKLIGDIVDAIPKKKFTEKETPKAKPSEKRKSSLAANQRVIDYMWENSVFDLPIKVIHKEIVLMSQNGQRYEYEIDSFALGSIIEQMDLILIQRLLGFGLPTFTPLNVALEGAFESGTADSFDSAERISQGVSAGDLIGQLDKQQRVSYPAYHDRLKLISGRAFEGMKGLIGELKSQLRLSLGEGMARGLGVKDIKGMIYKRLGIGMVRAERIARTEINNAYRTAYLSEAEDLNEKVLKDDPWEIKQAHRSALSPTTRPTHASRHGLVFHVKEQARWWTEDGNAINCLCSTLDVLVNKKTGEILQQDMIDSMIDNKSLWAGT